MTSAPAVRIDRDQVYRVVDGAELHVDVYAPDDRTPLAAVVYFHGGGWEEGGRTDNETGRMVPLAERGYLVASVQYRLTKVAPFPAQLDDARAAVDWVRGHAAEHGVAGDRVGAGGTSAGGHLAALLALGGAEVGAGPRVEAAVAWSAPLDLTTITGGTPLEQELFPPSWGEAFIGGRFDPGDPLHRAADPMSLVSSDASPMLLVTGDRDRVVDGSVSVRMHEALVRARATSSLLVVGGAGHEDPRLDSTYVLGAVAAFLEEHLVTR